MIPSTSNSRTQHDSAIQSLAEQTALPRETVAALYEAELEAMKPEVRITQFLSLIVSRRVLNSLHLQELSK
ncbi:MAG: DUF3562 domain-containing protein [Steroidobacteraceae bacterium]